MILPETLHLSSFCVQIHGRPTPVPAIEFIRVKLGRSAGRRFGAMPVRIGLQHRYAWVTWRRCQRIGHRARTGLQGKLRPGKCRTENGLAVTHRVAQHPGSIRNPPNGPGDNREQL